MTIAPLHKFAKQAAKSLISLDCSGVWSLELSNPGARAVLRRGLQPALVDAGSGASGPQGPFVVPALA